MDDKEIESIRKLEEATGIDLFCVVLTKARTAIPDASLQWDECKQDIIESLDVITEEFLIDYVNKKSQDKPRANRQQLHTKGIKKIKADADGLPTKESIRNEFLQILSRLRLQKNKPQWFKDKLCEGNERMHVPVIMLENHKLLQTETLAIRL